MSYYTTCPTCGASLDPGEKCDCVQTKEKSTETAATVNGANNKNQLQDTTNPTKKQPFEVSEYLEYCAHVGKQPNQNLIKFMESNNEPYQYSEKMRDDWELIEEITALSPSDRDDVIELIEFFAWKNQQKKSHIAAIPPG